MNGSEVPALSAESYDNVISHVPAPKFFVFGYMPEQLIVEASRVEAIWLVYFSVPLVRVNVQVPPLSITSTYPPSWTPSLAFQSERVMNTTTFFFGTLLAVALAEALGLVVFGESEGVAVVGFGLCVTLGFTDGVAEVLGFIVLVTLGFCVGVLGLLSELQALAPSIRPTSAVGSISLCVNPIVLIGFIAHLLSVFHASPMGEGVRLEKLS